MNILNCSLPLAAVLMTIPSVSWPQAQETDAKLDKFFSQYLDEHFQMQPMAATELGDHRFDALLDDVSRTSRERWLAHAKLALADLPKQVEYSALSRAGQIDYEIFKHDLETTIWLTENRHFFEEDPRTYVSYLNDSVYLLLTRSTLPKEQNIANAIARIANMGRVVAAAKENLTHPPKAILETAIRQNRGMISFYEKEIFDLAGETAQSDALKKAAASVVAILKDYQTFLEGDLMSRATGQWR